MNIKDFLIPSILALIVTLGFRYFFLSEKASEKPIEVNRSFVAPASEQVAEPLDFNIDFYDEQPKKDKVITNVLTKYGIITFSNHGGVIEQIDYNRKISGLDSIIQTISPSSDKESGTFLVALNGLGNTPYYYDLVNNIKNETGTSLTYVGKAKIATISKEFIIYDNIYRIDFNLTIEPQITESADDAVSLRPRIFFSGPFVSDPKMEDTNRGVYYSDKGTIEKKNIQDLNLFGKLNPSLFGVEDHYFVNMLFNDPQNFAKRAYFRLTGKKADAVLQSSYIKEKTTWKMSFYFGPKESSALSQVDKKLDAVIDYGWFWFISKPLLYLLNFIYNLVKSYGFAIILLTVLIRLALLPFTLKGEQARKKHIETQRKLKYLEQKYKDDPETLAREKTELVRKQGFGMLGCSALFLQIPIFIGLNQVLSNAIELYKVPFLWINDLSAKDPYYILPILTGLAIFFQTAQAGDSKQYIYNLVMAALVAAVTSNLSAGLALFTASSAILSVAQFYAQKALKI